MRRIVHGLIALGLAACQPAPIDLELPGGDIVFHSVLVAGSTDVVALLAKMPKPAGQGTQPLLAVPITDAVVEIGHGGSSWTLTHAPSGDRCYRLGWTDDVHLQPCYAGMVPGGIQPGATYTLRVRLADGRVVTGSTTVPALPRILEPAAGAVLDARRAGTTAAATPFVVRWEALPSSLRSELLLPPDSADCATTLPDGPGFGLVRNITGEVEAELVPSVGCRFDVQHATMPARIVVAVYDGNYTRHAGQARESRSLFAGEAAAGISGAFGVFGSMSADRRPVVLQLH